MFQLVLNVIPNAILTDLIRAITVELVGSLKCQIPAGTAIKRLSWLNQMERRFMFGFKPLLVLPPTGEMDLLIVVTTIQPIDG